MIKQQLPVKALAGETIVSVKFGAVDMPKCGSYGAYTLTMASGKALVIWQAYGEINLTEVSS